MSHLLFIGTTELLLIGGIALLIFGGKKIPEMMKGLGKGVKSFKEGMNEPLNDEETEKDNHEEGKEGEENKKEETEEKGK
ncbi:MAG: twin-arginine translocase TatA/TatE family subunit [Bacteroidales bacterium]|jgi:sec-independent protein translocase protein TatA|nr:twin-arginine translocase TatA/TatE family subunit [Bacteroidales bacterium]